MIGQRAMTHCVFLAVAWAGLMLAFAEGRAFPVPLSIPIVFFAWVTECRSEARCPGWLAALLGLLAFGAAFLEFQFGDLESRLLSIAHVVVYLTWIVLFLNKSDREYWLLLSLALLQIAVGAVLTLEGWYGLMLIFGVTLMLLTLSVFCFRKAHADYAAMSLMRKSSGKNDATNPFRQRGVASGGSQIDENETWLGSRFRRTLFKSLVATIAIGGAVFAAVPRIWIGNPIADIALKATREDRRVSLTGYSDTVRLGEMGTILESNEPVLRLRMIDMHTGESVNVTEFAQSYGMEEPLFRGTVMGDYRNGQWERARSDEFVAIPLRTTDQYGAQVRQEYELEPTRTRLLFVLEPYISITIDEERMPARVGRETEAIHYPRGRRKFARSYKVSSPNKSIRSFNPLYGTNRNRRKRTFDLMYLQVPGRLTQLKALAATVAGTVGGADPLPALQARRINDYLKDPERFTYSLAPMRKDKSLDPVEDFLVNHRTGNCEFYASAMTLMLRAQKIPARLVNGFKGGYTNSIDGTFEVQQMHAHTWVEAYIGGRWARFDPTPADRGLSVASMAPAWKPLTDLKMWLNTMWSQLVLNVSLEQQQRRFYEPVKNQFQTFADAVSGKSQGGWKDAFSRRVWFSVPGFLIVFATLLAIVIPFRFRLWRWIARLFGRRANADARQQREHPVVAFYEQFREICSRHGQTRQDSQTEREFAVAIRSQWSEQLDSAGLASFPGDLAEQFYHVRFGHAVAENMDEAAIRQQLTRLDECLSPAPA